MLSIHDANKMAAVQCIDTGKEETVELRSIRLLKNAFINVPAKAFDFECRLLGT